jgi:hypothetical protein
MEALLDTPIFDEFEDIADTMAPESLQYGSAISKLLSRIKLSEFYFLPELDISKSLLSCLAFI